MQDLLILDQRHIEHPYLKFEIRSYLSVDFQELKPSILEHGEACYPQESCGVIGLKKNKKIWTPITNISETEDTFVMNPKEYTKAAITQKILAVVHSHQDYSTEASKEDLIQCDANNIDYIIFNRKNEWNHVKPLKGRPYIWEKFDCLTLVSDYYKMHYDMTVTWSDRDSDWYNKGLDYFAEVDRFGFKEVQDLSIGNALLFKVRSSVENHCAIYLGNGKILHHSYNRLSIVEGLYPLWAKFLTRVLKHESLLSR